MHSFNRITHTHALITPSRWTADHVRAIDAAALPAAPLIDAGDASPILPALDLWDIWPIQAADGSVAAVQGGTLWMILSAPRLSDPNHRHDVARIRLLHKLDGDWRDCGPLFPDDFNPAQREWSGSAIIERDMVTVYFTGAGRPGTPAPDFEQRLFHTHGTLDLTGPAPRIRNWTPAIETVVNDARHYIDVRANPGVPGLINGFRDPCWFRDPADGALVLLFAGSRAGAQSRYCGAVGVAVATGHGFELCPPLIDADGLANELERPHMIFRDGCYYLFWSTQSSVFAPDAPPAPTGLYGMVAEALFGPYVPLNGSGLVIANPREEPKQAYCWQVLDTLDVVSFIDHWGLKGRDPKADASVNRAQFGGTVAPMLKLAIEGHSARLLGRA